jgi:hypothetical protein
VTLHQAPMVKSAVTKNPNSLSGNLHVSMFDCEQVCVGRMRNFHCSAQPSGQSSRNNGPQLLKHEQSKHRRICLPTNLTAFYSSPVKPTCNPNAPMPLHREVLAGSVPAWLCTLTAPVRVPRRRREQKSHLIIRLIDPNIRRNQKLNTHINTGGVEEFSLAGLGTQWRILSPGKVMKYGERHGRVLG